MDATWTITLHLWWVWAYLAVGVVSVAPLNYMEWRHLARPRPSFGEYVRPTYVTGRKPLWHPVAVLLVQIAAWPVFVWEVVS